MTKEKHVIRQVASFQLEQNGKLVKTIHPGWQSYVLPYLEGYTPNWAVVPPKATTPNSADEVEDITYRKNQRAPKEAYNIRIEFYAIDGQPMADKVNVIRNDKPVLTFPLPSPPEGWEYVDEEQLPKILHTVPDAGISYKFLVQKIQTPSHQENRVENKQLCRTITLHLPTGDQVITQHALATRNISVEGDKMHYGEWQISPFDEFQLPKIDGYQASLDKVAAQQLTADQLAQDPITVEVDYHKVVDDKGTGTGTTDDSTVTDPTPSGDKDSQTDDPTMSDGGTQTDQSTSTGTQTERPATDDGGTQTEPVTTKDDSTQTDQPAVNDKGTQTESATTKDDGTQTDQATMVDEGSQTATNETVDTGVGDDSIDDVDQGTQTESPTVKDDVSQTENKQQDDSTQTEVSTGKDAATQTAQPAVTDKDSQTSGSSTTDTGVGDDSIGDVDQGTQTESPTVKGDASQTENKQQDDSTQTETTTGKDEKTQTESEQQSTGTQTENSTEPSTSRDEDSQTDIIEKDAVIQEDHQITTTDDTGSNKGQINNATQSKSSTVNTNDPNWQGVTPSWPISNTKAGSQIDTAEASPTLDPLAFHNELNQLQQPLKELATRPQTHESSSLPQTGNHDDPKVSILGTLTMLMGAFLTALHLRKRH